MYKNVLGSYARLVNRTFHFVHFNELLKWLIFVFSVILYMGKVWWFIQKKKLKDFSLSMTNKMISVCYSLSQHIEPWYTHV